MTLSQFTNAKSWSTPAPMPKVSDRNWSVVQLLGLLLIVMAVCQVIGFRDFQNWLGDRNIGPDTAWAVGIIIAEVWAAVSFFKLRLAPAFRMVGTGLAILVAGFWLIENMQLVAGSSAGLVSSSGFFGRYLTQMPGWWTVLETTILMLWTLNAVHLVKNSK